MRLTIISTLSALLLGVSAVGSNISTSPTTQRILQDDFKPPQVFENTNLVRNTNLEKGYVRETINIVVTNKDNKPQSEYYVPFEYDVIGKVGGFEVRDKKNAEKGRFAVTTTTLSAVSGHDGSTTK